MGAVGLVFGVKLRRHWRSWVLLTLLIAIVSGFVLAATAAARRTDAAFPSYVARYGYDAIVYTDKPLPQLAQQPGVAQVVPIQMPYYGQPRCWCGHQIDVSDLAVREVPAADLHQVIKLVSGRMPDPSSTVEGLASFTLERDYGVHPGTVITLPMAAASQWPAILKAMAGGTPPKPKGPVIAVRIVGIVAAEYEFPNGETPTYDLYPSQAFAAATRSTPALPSYNVRLRNGLAGLALAGQALARQAAAEGADHPALAALGLAFDGAVIGLGALATVAVVLVLGVPSAVRGARARHPRGPGADRADRLGGRGGGLVRDRGLRQQPGPPDRHPGPVRRPLPNVFP